MLWTTERGRAAHGLGKKRVLPHFEWPQRTLSARCAFTSPAGVDQYTSPDTRPEEQGAPAAVQQQLPSGNENGAPRPVALGYPARTNAAGAQGPARIADPAPSSRSVPRAQPHSQRRATNAPSLAHRRAHRRWEALSRAGSSMAKRTRSRLPRKAAPQWNGVRDKALSLAVAENVVTSAMPGMAPNPMMPTQSLGVHKI